MKIIYLFPLLVFLFSCASENKKSDKINSEDVYQSYSINYDGEIAYIKAEFRIGAYWNRLETEKTGGEAVELVGPANVTFNGEKMNTDNSMFTGAYYSLKKEGVLNGDVTWVWTDNAGKKYTNTAQVNPIKLNEVSCSLNEDMIVTWEGLPVQENETVNVTVEGSVNDKRVKTSEFTSKIGATSVSFSPEELKQYSGEAISVEITRKALVPVSNGTKEGGVMSIYYDGNSVTTSVSGSVRY
jgi:hypothetical protein